MSQVCKDLNASKSSLAQSLHDTSCTVVVKAKRALTDAASTALVINMDKLNTTATAECNKLIGKAFDLQRVLVEADTKTALTEAHRLANDMVLSLESHVAQTSAHTDSCFDDIRLDLKALEDHIDSSDFVPRAA